MMLHMLYIFRTFCKFLYMWGNVKIKVGVPALAEGLSGGFWKTHTVFKIKTNLSI